MLLATHTVLIAFCKVKRPTAPQLRIRRHNSSMKHDMFLFQQGESGTSLDHITVIHFKISSAKTFMLNQK